MSLNLFLLVLAFVLIVLAALKTPEPPRLSFGWAGVALLVLTQIFGGLRF